MGSERPRAARLAIRGPLERPDLPGVYARACAVLAENQGAAMDCDVAGIAADAVAVEALARLQLGALRHGCGVRLVNASRELADLVAFMGLADVLPLVSRDGAAGRRGGRASRSPGRT